MMPILYCLLAALFLASVAGYSKARWWFSVLDFFHLQYAFAGLLIAGYGVYSGAWGLMLGGAALLILNFYRMRILLPRGLKPQTHLNKDVMSVNAHDKNKKPERLNNAILEADPSILLIMELTDEMEKHLEPSLLRYPFRLQTPVRDGFSICLLSKNKVEGESIEYIGPDDTPLLKAKTPVHGKLYQIYSAHPKPALNKKWAKQRNKYFDRLGDTIRQNRDGESSPLPVMVLGDFNSVPWEQHFQRFMHKAKLKSTLQGHGYKVTWPVYCLPMGIPMDHILVEEGTQYSKVSVGPNVGSDHYPVSLNL